MAVERYRITEKWFDYRVGKMWQPGDVIEVDNTHHAEFVTNREGVKVRNPEYIEASLSWAALNVAGKANKDRVRAQYTKRQEEWTALVKKHKDAGAEDPIGSAAAEKLAESNDKLKDVVDVLEDEAEANRQAKADAEAAEADKVDVEPMAGLELSRGKKGRVSDKSPI